MNAYLEDRHLMQDCIGCGVCQVVCKNDAITLKRNSDGFFQAAISGNCSNCGLCKRVCPVQNGEGFKNNDYIASYGVFSKDRQTLSSCSSGGVSWEIAKAYLREGYKVCGVKYNTGCNIAEHFIADNIECFEESKGSKYLQSYTVKAFSELFNGDKYVVFGTPCQIYALRKTARIKKLESNFLLVDFFCHGIPTYKLWEKELDFLHNCKGIEEIKKVYFRSKEQGWGSFVLKVEHKNGFYIDGKDMFLQMFLRCECLNTCCYNCNFTALNSAADIRIGDFWGKKFRHNREGVSAVITFSDKGQTAFRSISNSCEVIGVSIDDILPYQNDLYRKRENQKILNALKSGRSLKRIYISYILPQLFMERIGRIPSKIINLLRH